jgi:GNAT superfamily N-acetyltransferase
LFWHAYDVELRIRSARPEDREPLLAIASRAWEPVFASVNRVLGAELAELLHGEDWRAHHSAEIRAILDSDVTSTWVAEVDGSTSGFVAARVVDPARRIGEVRIVGVDPAGQRQGVGRALIRQAEAWLRDQGMAVVFIGSGGDPGHAPARAMYESLGYLLYPSAQYFMVLPDEA